eukprot:13093494-Alexandrium_andersonii.AAC.1
MSPRNFHHKRGFAMEIPGVHFGGLNQVARDSSPREKERSTCNCRKFCAFECSTRMFSGITSARPRCHLFAQCG